MIKFLLASMLCCGTLSSLEPIYECKDQSEILYRTMVISLSTDYIKMCINVCEKHPEKVKDMYLEILKVCDGINYDLGVTSGEMMKFNQELLDGTYNKDANL